MLYSLFYGALIISCWLSFQKKITDFNLKENDVKIVYRIQISQELCNSWISFYLIDNINVFLIVQISFFFQRRLANRARDRPFVH